MRAFIATPPRLARLAWAIGLGGAAALGMACKVDVVTSPVVQVQEAEPVELVEAAPSCELDFGVQQLTIAGTVRANRDLSDVTVQGYLTNPGAPRISVGRQSVGAMRAGESKGFAIRASVRGFDASAQCSITITWRAWS